MKKCDEYVAHMELMKSQNEPVKMYEDMIEKAANQMISWNSKLELICELLKSETKPQFHEIQSFLMDRLTSFGCSKNQGFVMNGFELDSEMASSLFLEPIDDEFEFNKATKPDYFIIMNRLMDQDDLCMDLKAKRSTEVEETNEKETQEIEMKSDLKKY